MVNQNKNHIVSAKQRLELSPRKSTRRLFHRTDLSGSSVMRIVHQDLRLFLHKIQILQLQTNANKAEKRAFGQTTSQRINVHLAFFNLFFQ